MLKYIGNDCCITKAKTNFRDLIFFLIFLILPQYRQFDFSFFEKVQIKNVNAVVCGKKVNASTYAMGNKFVLYILALLD